MFTGLSVPELNKVQNITLPTTTQTVIWLLNLISSPIKYFSNALLESVKIMVVHVCHKVQ